MAGSFTSTFALFLLAFALFFDVIGFSSPYWLSGNISIVGKVWYGLWKTCYEVLDNCVDTDVNVTKAWEKAVVAMEILGLMSLLASCVLAALSYFLQSVRGKQFTILTGVLALTAGGFILLGVIVFGAEYDNTYLQLSWAFVVIFLSAIASLSSGVLFLMNIKSNQIMAI